MGRDKTQMPPSDPEEIKQEALNLIGRARGDEPPIRGRTQYSWDLLLGRYCRSNPTNEIAHTLPCLIAELSLTTNSRKLLLLRSLR